MNSDAEQIKEAFVRHDREGILNNVKVGCLLGVVLMPAGTLLDYFVYRADVLKFLELRLLCSLLIAIFWVIVVTPFGDKHPRFLGVLLAMFPTACISYMIYAKDGSESLYYAGLNLVLLVIGFVLHWTLTESLIAVTLVVCMYITACLIHGHIMMVDFVNNLYFLSLTGVVVVTGSYVQSRWRFREFSLRFELDKNRKALEASLSQLKDNEMQLVQSEKLASLGRMSAGIIHEINNPLNYATTGLYTLRNKAKYLVEAQREEYTEVLADVEEGIKRVKTIVSDLRTFSHPDAGHCEQVPVTEALAAALRFLNNEWRDLVQIEIQIEPQLTVNANQNQLVHVLMNLLQNSLDALKTKTFQDEKPTIQITGRVEDGVSRLSIRDNGPGITGQHLDKIFDPFYTTKDVGEGMGLGLSICHRIIKESGGKISVKTEPGRFCEFTLEFSARKWDKSEGS